jgi:hypothetical protein
MFIFKYDYFNLKICEAIGWDGDNETWWQLSLTDSADQEYENQLCNNAITTKTTIH